MNEQRFLARLRELAHEPVPGPLPEQELVVRGRRVRRRRAVLRTATAAVGTALAVAVVVGVPAVLEHAAAGEHSADADRPIAVARRAATDERRPDLHPVGDHRGHLAGDAQLLAALKRRAWDVLYNGVDSEGVGRPGDWTGRKKLAMRAEDFHVLVAADLAGTRVALVRSMPLTYRGSVVTSVIWLAGPAGTPAAALTPADCGALVLLCPLSLGPDGRPLLRTDLRPASVLAATLVGAVVTAEANDVDPQGRLHGVGPAVSATEVAGLFRVDAVPDAPFALVARRGGGRTQVMVGVDGDAQALDDDLLRQLRAAGLPARDGADLRSGPDAVTALSQARLVREATLLPLVPGRVRVLHVLGRGSRTLVVFAVQAPSGGWAVVPTEYEGVGRSSWLPLVDGVVLAPAGDVDGRGYAWHSFWQSGHLQQKAVVSDTVAVLGPIGAVTARVEGRAGEVALTLTDRYGEGVVRGARHVRFLDADGAVVGESDVAPLLRPGRHMVGG